MTGQDINRVFEQQIGQTYSGIEDIPKKNRRFRRALINAVEEKYRNLDEEREYEELATFIITNRAIVPDSPNTVNLTSNAISHVLSIKAKYRMPIENLVIKSFSNTSPVVMELFTPSSIRKNDVLSISGVNTIANGEYVVLPLGRFKFALYNTLGTSSPTSPLGDYVPGPSTVISRVYYNYCQMVKSDEKISSWKQATEIFPLFEISEDAIKLYPIESLGGDAEEITLDYVTSDLVYFQLADNTIDYTLSYPEKFIYHVIDFAVKDFNLAFRDYPAAQATEQQIMLNP